MRVHELFRQTCLKFSKKQAVQFQSSEGLSYQRLDERSNQLAHYLLSLGIKAGDRIGIYFPRSLWQVTFMLALSKIGAVYVPFNPNDTTTEGCDPYKKHRDQIADCQLTRLMTSESFLGRAKNLTAPDRIITIELKLLDPFPTTLEATDNNDDVDAYILYSSGTTGAPKGIPIKHKGLEPWFQKLKQVIGEGHDNRVVAQIPNGFDAHIWEYLMAWSIGGCSYIVNDQTASNPVELVKYIIQNKIHDLTMTPAVMIQIMKNEKYIDEMAAAGLQRVYLTGEEITAEIVVALKKRGIKIFNCYGPTELTFGYSMLEVTEADIDKETTLVAIGLKSHKEVRGFIGKIDPNDDSKVFDPICVEDTGDIDEGELLIDSPYMTTGYIHPSEDNNKNFREITYKGEKLRVYATHDIVMLKNNKMFYKGRIGEVIKFKGMPINTKTVETELKKLIQSPRVLVFDVKLATGQQYLVTVLDLVDESKWQAVDKKQLRETLTTQSALSSRDVPQYYYSLKELGLIAMPTKPGSGKADLSAVRKHAKDKLKRELDSNDSQTKFTAELKQETKKNKRDINNIIKLTKAILLQLINQVRGDDLSYDAICNKTLREIGFQSLDSMGLHLEIEKYFNQSISQSSFETKAISNLTQELIFPHVFHGCFQEVRTLHDPKEVDPDSPVVFCLPPITGAISQYKILDVAATRLLAFESPLLNRGLLQHQDLYQDCKKFYCQLTMEELAHQIARTINEIQAEGEIYLGGWSFGGDLAWAVATKLMRMRRIVKSVFIIDSQAPMELARMSGKGLYQRLVGITEMILKDLLNEDDKKKILPDELINNTQEAYDKYQDAESPESLKKLIELYYLLLQKKLKEFQTKHPELIEKIERMQALFATCSAHVLMLLSWYPDEMGAVKLERNQLPHSVIFRAKGGIHQKSECNVNVWKQYVGEQCEVVEAERDHFGILESEVVLIKFRDSFAARLPYSKTLRGALRQYYGSQSSIPLTVLNQRMPLADTINMALVSSKEQQQHEMALINAGHTNRLRNYEDVFCFEREIDYQNLFARSNKHIVMGRAGIGKSTFVRTALHRWARGEIWQQFKTVIPVSLRHLQNYQSLAQGNEATNQQVAEFVVWALKQDNTQDESLTRYITSQAICELLDSEDSNVLWLLDGFDEIEKIVRDGAAKLIFERLKKQRNLIITSRPNAISQSSLNQDFDSKFELLGFKEDDIKRCVLAIFKLKDPATAEVYAELFIKHLKTNPNLWGLAHIPINIEIMASVLEPRDIGNGEFISMALLYKKVVTKLMERYLAKEPWRFEELLNVDVVKLTADLECYLSGLAFMFTRENQLYFNDDDLAKPAIERDELAKCLKTHIETMHAYKGTLLEKKLLMRDLLIPVRNSGFLNSLQVSHEKHHYFIHLTFQEYYAALELAKHHRSNLKLLQEIFSDPRYETTLQFYTGLIADDPAALQSLFNVIDTEFVSQAGDLAYNQYKSDSDDFTYYHYEIKPEILCRAILLLEQCSIFSIRQCEAIFRAIRRAVGLGLVFPKFSPEYNSKYRKTIIDRLKQCPRVLQQSKITDYLQKTINNPYADIGFCFKITLRELLATDYFDCLDNIIRTDSGYETRCVAFMYLLPHVETHAKVFNVVISLLCDFSSHATLSVREESVSSREDQQAQIITIASLLNILQDYPKQRQIIFERLEALIFQTDTPALKIIGAIKILASKRNFPIEKMIPIAKQQLGAEYPSIRYEAAKLLLVFLDKIDEVLDSILATALRKNLIANNESLILPSISLIFSLYCKYYGSSDINTFESLSSIGFWCWPTYPKSLSNLLRLSVIDQEVPEPTLKQLRDQIVSCEFFSVTANTENLQSNTDLEDDSNHYYETPRPSFPIHDDLTKLPESKLLCLLHDPSTAVVVKGEVWNLIGSDGNRNDNLLQILIKALHSELDLWLMDGILKGIRRTMDSDKNIRDKLLPLFDNPLSGDEDAFIDEQRSLMLNENKKKSANTEYNAPELAVPVPLVLMNGWKSCFLTPPVPKVKPNRNTSTALELGYYELYGLLGANNNVDGLCQVIEALGKITLPFRIKLLLNSLIHNKRNVRDCAMWQLQQVNDFSEEEFALLATMSVPDEYGFRGYCVLRRRLLINLVRSNPQYFNQLISYINHPQPVRLGVFEVLLEVDGLIQDNKQLRWAIIEGLEDPNVYVRVIAIQLVGKLGKIDDITVEKIVNAFCSLGEEEQYRLAESFSELLDVDPAIEDKMLEKTRFGGHKRLVRGAIIALCQKRPTSLARLEKRIQYLTQLIDRSTGDEAILAFHSLCRIAHSETKLFHYFNRLFLENSHQAVQGLRLKEAIALWANGCREPELRIFFENCKESNFREWPGLLLHKIEALVESDPINKPDLFALMSLEFDRDTCGLGLLFFDKTNDKQLGTRYLNVLYKDLSLVEDFLKYLYDLIFIGYKNKPHYTVDPNLDFLRNLDHLFYLITYKDNTETNSKSLVNNSSRREILLKLITERIIQTVEKIIEEIIQEELIVSNIEFLLKICGKIASIDNNKIVDFILKLTTHNHANTRSAAAKALAEVKYYDTQIEYRLVELVRDPDSLVCVASLKALGLLKYHENEGNQHVKTVQTILSMTTNSNINVRIAAIDAIGKLSFTRDHAREVAIQAMNDSAQEIRRVGIKAWRNGVFIPQDIHLLTRWLITETDGPTTEEIIQSLISIAIEFPQLMLAVITNLNLFYYQHPVTLSQLVNLIPQSSDNNSQNNAKKELRAHLSCDGAATTNFFRENTNSQQPQPPNLQPNQTTLNQATSSSHNMFSN